MLQSVEKEEYYCNELEDNFNLENCTKALYKSRLQFIVSLYNYNNFNKSDVHNIQSGVKENILKPLASILNNIVKKHINEPALQSKFNNLEGVILNPIFYCSIEYHLNN